jgi:hypothetical protein
MTPRRHPDYLRPLPAPVQRNAAARGRSISGAVDERPLTFDDVLATIAGVLVFGGIAWFFLVLA